MMKYAIIAAGEGSRLKQGGIHTPKPLITILETPLIEMHIRRAEKYGFGEICVIVNDLTPEPAQWLANHKSSLPLETLVKTTPGSMYSFHALSPLLKNSEFLLTTVDPVFTEQAFEKFLQTVNSQSGADGIMAVTSLVDDDIGRAHV